MRWQQLFADLRAQFEAEEAAEDRVTGASRARAEMGAVDLVGRLRGSVGLPLTLRCRGAGPVAGTLTDAGVDWLLLEDEQGRSILVANSAVRAVTGLGRRTAVAEYGVVRARMDLRWALRGLARDRSAVQIVLDDGGVLTGTVDRVGADHVELAEHPADLPRRAEAVQGVAAVVIAAIAVVRTLPPGLG
ncbi:MAG: hypothetical protein QOJ68_3557 [Blastococcus sp.]|jgi:hypothetical protein|nr:hypothetical protein [Blastococcus sp.]